MDRSEVIEAAKRFYDKAHPPAPFIAGTTYIPVTAKVLDFDDLQLLLHASLDLWLTAGPHARQFERAFAKKHNKPKALLVNSGSSANLVSVSSLKLKPGDEVITAACGFPTTVNPILQNGATPVFVDVNKDTLNVEPETLFESITTRTRAIVLAHTLGNPYRADTVRELCDKEDLFLVEDCCDALGATIGPDPIGTFGDFATFSFYPAHQITMGEGGAVLARTQELARVAESLRDWGRDCWCLPGRDNTCGKRFCQQHGSLPQGYDHKYTYSEIGYNLKVTDMQAALGVSQLKKLDGFVTKRRENWALLNAGLHQSPVLREHLSPTQPTPGTTPSPFGFALHCAQSIDRNRLVRYLEDNRVGTRLVFAGNLTKQPAYRSAHYRIHGDLKNTDEIMRSTLWIGVHPAITPQMIDYMLETLEKGVNQQTLN